MNFQDGTQKNFKESILAAWGDREVAKCIERIYKLHLKDKRMPRSREDRVKDLWGHFSSA